MELTFSFITYECDLWRQMFSSFTFGDLFAGVGGMRLAFEDAGGVCVLTSEIDPKAMQTYKANFKETASHKYVNDVCMLKTTDFPDSHVDVIVAGFPCQPYSIAGLRKGLDDDRGGQIFKSLANLIANLKPNAFLLENVKGIRSHDKGRTFDFMLQELSRGGYHLRHETLNSMTHANVPQNRERVFIVGFSSSEAADSFQFPEPIDLTSKISDILLHEDQIDDKYYYSNRYPMFQQINEAVTNRETIYQWRRQYVRENKSRVCPTLTANMGSGGHNVPLVRDSKGVRKLTPRETANFQGFPDSFIMPQISDANLYHQFGNSVTVPLIRLIATEIAKSLEVAIGAHTVNEEKPAQELQPRVKFPL